MKRKDEFAVKQAVFAMLSFAVAFSALLVASGCSAKSDSKTAAERAKQGSAARTGRSAATAQVNTNPGIDLQCVANSIQNPSTSFHYSYKKDSSNPVHQEADITPQSIDGFRVDVEGQQHPLHGVHSDPQSWQQAWSGLMGIAGMSSTVATFNNTSAMRREADGSQVNGYNTIHYSIDTARWDATEQKMLGNFALGPGGFDKGDAWVTSEGCPVKLVLDDEMHKKDGSLLEKVHYEEAMVKK